MAALIGSLPDPMNVLCVAVQSQQPSQFDSRASKVLDGSQRKTAAATTPCDLHDFIADTAADLAIASHPCSDDRVLSISLNTAVDLIAHHLCSNDKGLSFN